MNYLWQWTLNYFICQELVAPHPFSVAHQTPTMCSSHKKSYLSSSLIVLSDISRYMWTWIFHWSVKLLFPQSHQQLLQDGNCVLHFTYILKSTSQVITATSLVKLNLTTNEKQYKHFYRIPTYYIICLLFSFWNNLNKLNQVAQRFLYSNVWLPHWHLDTGLSIDF